MTTARKRQQEWSPRLWHGGDLFAWMRLLVRNHFAVQPSYWYIAVVASAASVFNSAMRVLSDACFGGRIARTPFRQAPLFIVGHWRTGTTLLHELLILDPRHTFPNNYQCMAPHHFLLTEWIIPRLGWFLAPSRRPMDNMEFGWDKPQEDEFALCLLGQPSPYTTIAFPNHAPQDQDAFDLEQMPPRAVAGWKRAFLHYLRSLMFKNPGRLILKSPTHSCRIPTLLQLFPDARFVHIVRDPYVIFPSTVNLWKALYKKHGFQRPTFAGLEEYIFWTFRHLYERLEQAKKLVAPERFHEMRYEDLIRDPEGQMHLLYERLQLGGFEEALPRIRKYLAEHAGYQTNRYPSLTPELRAEITRRWGAVIERYGYGKGERGASAP
jgi:omega-hydroxy-beta-dihydromenaquinone-9 sulfotransferase